MLACAVWCGVVWFGGGGYPCASQGEMEGSFITQVTR